MSPSIRLWLSFMLAAAFTVNTRQMTAASEWVQVQLESLGGFSGAAAINNHGQIVGNSSAPAAFQHAVLWEDGRITDLGTLPTGDLSVATAINNRGQIVGVGTVEIVVEGVPTDRLHAILWDNGNPLDLGTLPGDDSSSARDINDDGVIVGSSGIQEGMSTAVFWYKGSIVKLPHLPGMRSALASGINERGQIIGAAYNDFDSEVHAVLWEAGTVRDLGRFPDDAVDAVVATDINNRGQVVGVTQQVFPDDDVRRLLNHAFLWEAGSFMDLPTLVAGPRQRFAAAVNERGQVVGWADAKAGTDIVRHAVVWDHGTIIDLERASNHHSSASGINNRGDIVGNMDTDGPTVAVLWTRHRPETTPQSRLRR